MIDTTGLIGEAERHFWENELDVPVEDVLQERLGSEAEIFQWVDRLPPFAFGSLCLEFGVEETVEALGNFVQANPSSVAPFALCEAFIVYKRNDVLVDVAERVLIPEVFQESFETPKKPSRLRLTWELYKRGLQSLKEVALLNALVRHGLARLDLIHAPLDPANEPAGFFELANIQTLLDQCDTAKSAKLKSYCNAVLDRGDGRRTIYVRRALKPAFVGDGDKNVWGHDRELIILRFEPSMRTVEIAAQSDEVPVQFANQIASAYFGKPVKFDLSTEISNQEQVYHFLQNLAAREAEFPIVEFKVRNSGLHQSPEVTFSEKANRPINRALREFSEFTHDVFANPADVAHFKLFMFGKRVKVTFEQLGARTFVVRYQDAKLKHDERIRFVALIKEQFGIDVRSSEKRRVA